MNNASNSGGVLEKFLEKIDITNLEGKQEEFYNAGLAYVENGQFDDGIVEFLKVIISTSNQDLIYIKCEEELGSMGFSKDDIQAVVGVSTPESFHFPKSEKNSPVTEDVNSGDQKNKEEKIYKTVSLISSVILFVFGSGSFCLGMIGLGTGDEGGRQESMPFVIIFPVASLLVFLLSKGLYKLGETRYALFIEILSIALVIFFVIVSFK